jgi:hypothetical protein
LQFDVECQAPLSFFNLLSLPHFFFNLFILSLITITTMPETKFLYSRAEVNGVIVLASFGALSLAAVLLALCVLAAAALRRLHASNRTMYPMTHLALFFGSLIFSNILQAIGNIMDIKWAIQAGVREGGFCTAQGAIKQVSNLGVSFWSLVISVHAFTILFLRWKPRRWTAYSTFVAVWTFIAILVAVLPRALMKPGIPYFGIAGYWCWIRREYSTARIVLEYLWMYVSVGVSTVLYALIFLRLRGNLLIEDGKWSLRWVAADETWQLQIGRDLVDTHMLKVASHTLLYPLAFVILILPITAVRMTEKSGDYSARFEVIIFAAIAFGLNGLVNALLLMSGRKLLPDDESLPTVSMKRTISPIPSLAKNGGIVPFMLPPLTAQMEERRVPTDLTKVRGLDRSNSARSIESVSSQLGGGAPLHPTTSIQSIDSTSQLIEPPQERSQ